MSEGSLQPDDLQPKQDNLTSASNLQPDDLSASKRTLNAAIAVLCLFESLLLLVTWPLWTGGSSFPAIPLFPLAILDTPAAVAIDRLFGWLFPVTVVLCFLTSVTPLGDTWQRRSRFLSLVIATGLVIANQHRLQPWHWLFMLSMLAATTTPAWAAIRVLRAIVASVYIFSALSRASPEIVDGMTGQIVGMLYRLAELPRASSDTNVVSVTAWIFVAGELAAGTGMLFHRIRRCSIIASVVLHLTLITALGPFGLKHHWGVLIWNAMFLCLVPMLWAPMLFAARQGVSTREKRSATKPNPASHRVIWRYRMMLVLVILFPASGLFGIADNWLSWQLYSPRPEVIGLFIRPRCAADLPKSLQKFVSEPNPIDDFCIVRLDRWCLNETGAPIYPEGRFQIGIIRRITSKIKDTSLIRITIDSPDPIRWWRRSNLVFDGSLVR